MDFALAEKSLTPKMQWAYMAVGKPSRNPIKLM
jgi:hypothetical protein